jgi:Zn-dependent protease/CBS domain-containing protein
MRVGRFFGIDLYIHWGWLFIFALVAWSLAATGGPLAGLTADPTQRIALGFAASLLLFASVVAHEFAHSLVARSLGLRVSRITLYLFGGVSQLEDAAKSPGVEAAVTVVGPLTSILIAVVLGPVANWLGPATPAGAVAHYLSYANWVLGIFNLLPAIPLDGGRLFHSLAWMVTKNSVTATEAAAVFSKVIAGAIVLLGIAATLRLGFGGGLWLVLIGWFIWQSGSAEVASAELVDALKGKKAIDIAALPADEVPADATAQSAFERVQRSGRNAVPVVLGDRLLGIVSLSDFVKVAPANAASTPVTAIMTRVEDLVSARPGADAIDVARMLGLRGFRQIPLIDEAGRLAGFVTREGVLARISMPHHSS